MGVFWCAPARLDVNIHAETSNSLRLTLTLSLACHRRTDGVATVNPVNTNTIGYERNRAPLLEDLRTVPQHSRFNVRAHTTFPGAGLKLDETAAQILHEPMGKKHIEYVAQAPSLFDEAREGIVDAV
jgi:hypothetical protein